MYQALAYKPLVNGRDGIVADQTGTGKTLAYLAPLLQRIHAEEVGGGERAGPNQTFMLVLVPTTELAAQVSTPPSPHPHETIRNRP